MTRRDVALRVLLALVLASPITGCGRHAAEEGEKENKEGGEKAEGKKPESEARGEKAEGKGAGDEKGEKSAEGEEHHEPGVVVLDAEGQEHAGLGTEPLATVAHAGEVEALGTVEDPQALAEAVDALSTAHAEADKARAEREAARRERDRLVKLRADDGIASAREVEAAEARLATAEAALTAASSGVAARDAALERRLGSVLAARLKPGSADLTRLLRQDDVLVTATLPRAARPPASVEAARVETPAGASVAARSVTPARHTDPRLLGTGYDLVVAAEGSGLLPGMTARVFLATGEQGEAVAVPETAVVSWEGKDWVYVKEGDDRFVRHEVPPPAGGRRFLGAGETLAGPVVTRGAATLLSEELKGQIQGEE